MAGVKGSVKLDTPPSLQGHLLRQIAGDSFNNVVHAYAYSYLQCLQRYQDLRNATTDDGQ